jgi:hypothetical protein
MAPPSLANQRDSRLEQQSDIEPAKPEQKFIMPEDDYE